MPRPTPPRELTYADVEHPEFLHGRQTWHPGMNLHDLADRIKNGDPTHGWEGDARLTLARYTDPETRQERWELWRLEAAGGYNLVAKLPGDRDPSGIIPALVERDFRRGLDLKESIDRHNAKVEAVADAKVGDRLGAASEKLAWALRKDGIA